jgi:hypothetical protein
MQRLGLGRAAPKANQHICTCTCLKCALHQQVCIARRLWCRAWVLLHVLVLGCTMGWAVLRAVMVRIWPLALRLLCDVLAVFPTCSAWLAVALRSVFIAPTCPAWLWECSRCSSAVALDLSEAHLHRKALRDIKRAERKMRTYSDWARARESSLRLPERGGRFSIMSLSLEPFFPQPPRTLQWQGGPLPNVKVGDFPH